MQNKFDNIPIPERLDEVVISGMKQIRKIKNRRLRNKVIAASAATVIAIGGIGITNPAIASKLPIIGEIFSQVEKKITFSGDYSSLAKKVNEYTLSSNGLDITLSEIYCDSYSVYVTMEMDYEKDFERIGPYAKESDVDRLSQQVLCNSKVSVIDNHGERKLMRTPTCIEGAQTGPNSFAGVMKINLNDLGELDGNFELKLELNNISVYSVKRGSNLKGVTDKDIIEFDINGEWNFDIPIDVNKESSKKIDINEENDLGFGIRNIVVTPFQIIVESISPKKLDDIEFGTGIAIFNNDGETVQFQEGHDKEDGSKITIFSTNNIDTSELHIYTGENFIKTVKQKDENEMKKMATYSKTIKVK